MHIDGKGRRVEVCLEWGIDYFQDDPGILQQPASLRRVRRTEPQVLEVQGAGTVASHADAASMPVLGLPMASAC